MPALDLAVHKRIRAAAIEALGTLQSRSAVSTLLKLLQHTDDTIAFKLLARFVEASAG